MLSCRPFIHIFQARSVINYVAWYETITNMSEIPSRSPKRNQVTDDEQPLTSTYSDSVVRFLYSETNNNNDSSSLNDLDLAVLTIAGGLIQLLVENNFTLKSLSEY
jgi:hypothetical protein